MSIINTDNLKNILSKFKEKMYTSINKNSDDISQLSNPNLLINGDFQVWQRGTSFENKNCSYMVDGWHVNSNKKINKSTLNGNTSILITSINSEEEINLEQFMDIDIQKYKGTTLTCSWISNVSDDCDITFLIYTFNSSNQAININCGTNKYSSELNYEKHKISFTIPIDLENSCKMLVIRPIRHANKNDIRINITNIKLELGTVSTPFVSKSYEEELSSCQRYYIGGELIGIPFFIQQDHIRFAFSIPTTMKNTPTLINEDFL